MAEEQEKPAEIAAETAPAPPPKSSKLLVIVVMVLLLGLGGGGYFAYVKFVQTPAESETAPTEKTEDAGKEREPQPSLGTIVNLDPFLVNLAGSKGKRFLKVAVSLELSAPEVQVEVKDNLNKITDSILVLLSTKRFEEVYSIRGKFKLKDEIVSRVNRFLVMGHVKDVYFTEFVIQ